MKLYDVPNGSYIRIQVTPVGEATLNAAEIVDNTNLPIGQIIDNMMAKPVRTPIASPELKEGEIIYFDHIDGAYSFCQKVDLETSELGEVCHLAAWQEVDIVDLEEVVPFEKIREVIGRAGYGKDGTGAHRSATLSNMSDEWVEASIPYVGDSHPHRKFYIKELEYRKNHNISLDDDESRYTFST